LCSWLTVAEKDRGATEIGQYGLPHFGLLGVGLRSLLSFSFDVQPANFIGAPHVLDNEVFDIQVKSADGISLTYQQHTLYGQNMITSQKSASRK